jgi:hypothetical protein
MADLLSIGDAFIVPVTEEEEQPPPANPFLVQQKLDEKAVQKNDLLSESDAFPPPTVEDVDQRLIANGVRAGETTPAEAAADRKLAIEGQIPSAAVGQTTRDTINKTNIQNRLTSVPETASTTRDLLGRDDSLLSSVAHDDLPNLVKTERIAQELGFFGNLVGPGIDKLQAQFFRFLDFSGEITGFRALEEFGEKRAIAEFKEIAKVSTPMFVGDIKNFDDFKTFLQNLGVEAPSIAPSLISAYLGAKGGALLGTLGGPAAFVTVPVGTVVGGLLGAFIPSLILNIGDTQQSVKQRGGEQAEAPGIVLATGALAATLDMLVPGRIASKFVKLVGIDVAEDTFKLIATKVMKKAAVQGLWGMHVEGITEAVQEAIIESGAAFATDTKIDPKQLARDMTQAFAVGMFLGGGTASSISVVGDVARARNVRNALDELHELKKNSKLNARAPELAAEVIEANLRAAGIEHVLVPIDVVLNYMNNHPTLLAGEALDTLGVVEGMETAIQNKHQGGDTNVRVDARAFAESVLGTDGYQIFAPFIKLHESQKSQVEASEELQKTIQEIPERLASELEAYEASAELKKRVEKVLAEIKEGNAYDILSKADKQTVMILLDLVSRVEERAAPTAEIELRGRVTQLEADISQHELAITRIEDDIEAREKENKTRSPSRQLSTVRLENQLQARLADREKALGEIAEINIPERAGGLIEGFEEQLVPAISPEVTEIDALEQQLVDLQAQKVSRDEDLARAKEGGQSVSRIQKDRTQLNKDIKAVEDQLAELEKTVSAGEPKVETRASRRAGKPVQLKARVLQDLGVKLQKEAVRAARQGFKAGLEAGKTLSQAKNALRKIINNTEGLNPNQKKTLNERIDKSPSIKSLQKLLPKIEARTVVMVESERRKQIKEAAEKIIKSMRPETVGGRKIGKDADVQEVFALADSIMSSDTKIGMTAERAQEQLDEARENNDPKPEDIFRNQLLALRAGDSSLSLAEAENLLLDLERLKQTGKGLALERKKGRADKVKKQQDFVIELQGKPSDSRIGIRAKLRQSSNEFHTWLASTRDGWSDILDLMSARKEVDPDRLDSYFTDLNITNHIQRYKARRYKWANQLTQIGLEAFELKTWSQLSDRLIEDSSPKDYGPFEIEVETIETDPQTGEETITISHKNIGKLQYSKSQLRKLWMEWQDPSLKLMMESPHGMGLTQEVRDKLFSDLTQQDEAYALAQLAFYKSLGKQVDGVYRGIYGIGLDLHENYSPIMKHMALADDHKSLEVQSINVGERAFRRSLPTSLTRRVPNFVPLKKQSDIAAMQRYINDMAWFMETRERVQDIKAVFSNASVRTEIEKAHGPGMPALIDGFIQDFGMGYAARSQWQEKVIGWMNRNFTKSLLAIPNFKVGVKQTVSWFAMMEDMPVSSFMASHGDFFRSRTAAKKIVTFMYENFPLLPTRSSSLEFELQWIGSLEARMFKWKKTQSLERALFSVIRMGDRMPIYAGGWAQYQHAIKSKSTGGKGMTHLQAVDHVQNMISSTQQSTDIDRLTAWQRMGSIGRTFSLFMTARLSLLRGQTRAWRHRPVFLGGTGRIGYREFGKRMAYYQLAIPMFIQIISSGFKIEEDRLLIAALLGQYNSYIILGDILQAVTIASLKKAGIIDPALKQFAPDTSLTFTTIMKEMMRGVSDAMDSTDAEEFLEAFKDISVAIGLFTGAPVKSTINFTEGMQGLLEGEDIEKNLLKVMSFTEPSAAEAVKSDFWEPLYISQ